MFGTKLVDIINHTKSDEVIEPEYIDKVAITLQYESEEDYDLKSLLEDLF